MPDEKDVPSVIRRRLRDLPDRRQRAFAAERFAPLLPPDEPPTDEDAVQTDPDPEQSPDPEHPKKP